MADLEFRRTHKRVTIQTNSSDHFIYQIQEGLKLRYVFLHIYNNSTYKLIFF